MCHQVFHSKVTTIFTSTDSVQHMGWRFFIAFSPPACHVVSQRLVVVPPPATDTGRQLVNAPGKLPSFLIPKTKLAPRGKLPKYNVDIEERPFSIHFPEAHSIGFFLPMHIYQPPRFGTAESQALVMASLPVPVVWACSPAVRFEEVRWKYIKFQRHIDMLGGRAMAWNRYRCSMIA